jgi:hypothetical protein
MRSTRRWPRSWARCPGPARSSTARPPTPATWRPSPATARRAQEALARAAAGRRDPQRLRHDRARGGLVRRHQHRGPHRASGRRLRHQRPQVVDQRRRRPALQGLHLHGQDRPGRAAPFAAVDGAGAGRHPGHHGDAAAVRVRLRRRAARPHGGAVRERARAGVEHPARRRPRLRDRAGPPGPGPHPPLHAHHRPGRACARTDVPPRQPRAWPSARPSRSRRSRRNALPRRAA